MPTDTKVEKETLDSFIKGLRETATHIHEYDPQHLLFPMLGSLAFSDGLNVVDPNFDVYRERSQYLPASVSRGFRDISAEWLLNYIDSVDPKSPTRFMFVDEVVSGNCVRALTEAMDGAVESYAERIAEPIKRIALSGMKIDNVALTNSIMSLDQRTGSRLSDELAQISDALRNTKDKQSKKTALTGLRTFLKAHYKNMIDYKTIAIEHANGSRIQHGNTYDKLVKFGKVVPVKVDRIITMDDPDMAPAKYRQNGAKYLPEIDVTAVHPRYLELMKQIAEHMGVDLSKVSFPFNQSKVMSSHQFLNRNYRK